MPSGLPQQQPGEQAAQRAANDDRAFATGTPIHRRIFPMLGPRGMAFLPNITGSRNQRGLIRLHHRTVSKQAKRRTAYSF
jgi:hypothetical protein